MFYLFYIICYIAAIIVLILANNKKDKKYFNIFGGIMLATGVAIFYYFYIYPFVAMTDEGTDLGDAVLYIFFLFANIISFLTIGIVGLVRKKIIEKKEECIDTSKKITFIIPFLLTIIIFTIIVLSGFLYSHLDKKYIKESAINYLENKYGDNDFEVINVSEEYGLNGIVSKYLVGYNIIVKSPKVNKKIIVNVDENLNEYEDNLINVYCDDLDFENDITLKEELEKERQKLEEYLKQKYNVTVNIDYINLDEYPTDAIPNNFSKIPTKDELRKFLYKYILSNYLEITVDSTEIDDKLYSMEEAKKMLADIKSSNYKPYTLNNLTVYDNNGKEVKTYLSNQDLLNNLNKDINVIAERNSSVMEKRLLAYYEQVANYLTKYDKNLNNYLIICHYLNDYNYHGYIYITKENIYLQADLSLDIRINKGFFRESDKIISRGK